MKKVLALMMAVMLLCCGLAGCGAASNNSSDVPQKTDMQYIKDKGELIVGITDFAPMDYQDADGKWIGFDAEMAELFAKRLGVKAKFQIVDWNNKAMELDGKTVDVIWNGMTLTDEVKAAMDCSNAYCNNAQIVVVKADKADQYKTVDSVKGLKFAVENGSAGEEQVTALGAEFVEVDDQALALAEVKAGTVEAAAIDSLMAAAMVGEGTGFADLMYTVKLNSEEYGVGFRKGSDLVAEINDFFADIYADGTMMTLAKKYKVQEALIEQK